MRPDSLYNNYCDKDTGFLPAAIHWLGQIACIMAVGLSVGTVQAQLLTNAGQVITISANTTVVIEGGIQNNGNLINNGTLDVSGDWNNTQSYNEGTGTVILSGTQKQQIQHNNQAFSGLHIVGGGEKVFVDNVEINRELYLQNGLITTSPGSVFSITAQAAITGGSAQSYINGRLCHTGTGYRFFPIGKNGHYAPLGLENIEGVDLVTGFEMFEPNPDSKAGEGLAGVSQVRYWERTVVAGTFTGALLTLGFNPDEKIADLDLVVIAELNTETGTYQSLGKETVTGTVTEGNITGKKTISGTRFAVGSAGLAETAGILYCPNAFAPASSNAEEKAWKVYGNDMAAEGLFLRIYNRWGNLIYESRSFEKITNEGWDGRNLATGQAEAPGVYTYTLTGKFKTGKLINKTGTITLIR
jgi:hypothetical protein